MSLCSIVDDSLAGTGFTNETIATPDISHTYDPYYRRPATMVDGHGTTSYSYVGPGTNGAGKLASVDGPFSSDTIGYTYDELGRVLTRMLNGTGTEITYDTLGRPSQLEFPIGTFDYTYVGTTGRRAGVTLPNGQTTTYGYLDADRDFRLQTIHHKNPSAATLNKFDYTYDDREYDPSGKLLGDTSSGFAFTAREWDAETGLHYYRARYFDAEGGRFLAEDPIGFSAGTNFYAYVSNNPVRAVDPSGLEDIIVIENGSTGLFNNPAGHTAVAITGYGVYSYGNSTKLGSSIEEYLNREAAKRNTVVYVIPTTRAQDQAALRAVLPAVGMGVVFDNCASRSNRILDAAGIPYPTDVDPDLIFFPNLPGMAGYRAASTGANRFVIPKGGSIPAGLLQSIK